MTKNQLKELGKNLDAILQKTLPAKAARGNVDDVIKLIKTDKRFRFLDQIPVARQKVQDAFLKQGVKFE